MPKRLYTLTDEHYALLKAEDLEDFKALSANKQYEKIASLYGSIIEESIGVELVSKYSNITYSKMKVVSTNSLGFVLVEYNIKNCKQLSLVFAIEINALTTSYMSVSTPYISFGFQANFAIVDKDKVDTVTSWDKGLKNLVPSFSSSYYHSCDINITAGSAKMYTTSDGSFRFKIPVTSSIGMIYDKVTMDLLALSSWTTKRNEAVNMRSSRVFVPITVDDVETDIMVFYTPDFEKTLWYSDSSNGSAVSTFGYADLTPSDNDKAVIRKLYASDGDYEGALKNVYVISNTSLNSAISGTIVEIDDVRYIKLNHDVDSRYSTFMKL